VNFLKVGLIFGTRPEAINNRQRDGSFNNRQRDGSFGKDYLFIYDEKTEK
jgi:hypothetical protein